MDVPFAKPYAARGRGRGRRRGHRLRLGLPGPRSQAFEEAFAARVGAPEAVATTNCTTALQLAALRRRASAPATR